MAEAKAKKTDPEPEQVPAERVIVRFSERPGLRLISARDWEEAGVKDHADTLWGPSNDWIVSKADLGLTDEQYSRIILADRYFREERIQVEE